MARLSLRHPRGHRAIPYLSPKTSTYALRDLTAKLLATRFDLEIHVNRQCQAPCGRYALASANPTQ